MTFTETHVKWSVTLEDRLGPKTDVRNCIVCVHIRRILIKLKVDLNALLTRKLLPMVFSRLNEISGSRGNMCLVSGSLPKILKFLRMTFLCIHAENHTPTARPDQNKGSSVPCSFRTVRGFSYVPQNCKQ